MTHWIRKQLSKNSAAYLGIALILVTLGLLTGCAWQPGGLLRPNGIAVAPDGTLFIMDRGNYRVVHASAGGEILSSFGQLGRGPDDIFSGWDLELDAGGRIYLANLVVADEGSFRPHDGVKVFSPEGHLVRELGGEDYDQEGEAQRHTPYGLDLDRQGRVYVAGFDSNILRIFGPDGTLLASLFGEQGAEEGQFSGMTDVAVDEERQLIYLTDQANSRVQQFQLLEPAPGQISAEHRLSFGGYGREPGQFAYPQNIVVDDRSGRVYVSDMGNRRIQVFDPEGQYLAELAAPGDWQVIGLDLGPEGAIYAIDARNNLVWIFGPDGQPRSLEVGS